MGSSASSQTQSYGKSRYSTEGRDSPMHWLPRLVENFGSWKSLAQFGFLSSPTMGSLEAAARKKQLL
ncbi:glycerate kinase [Histoplasma capsulatum G186AR]|uniref:Glycerate kinase n=1 Tax=Ajellomyces capsulatus TaxID=5037 RepID=A0A8H7YK14_AJECA|nr:glycerate kinase [Histoplasma capsulatum]QSS72912.1 glycerate kinase [Histoplasma capsulatum G186AR]